MPDGQRRIVVTGATRGLGRAMVERFIEAGHQVAGCGRSADAIAELQRKYGALHQFAVVDVTDDTAVAAWAKSVISTLGVPDLLINNAALMNHVAPLWQIPAAEFNSLMQVNIIGVANCIRHFVPSMVDRKSGVIVNFSSAWGRSVSAEVAPYCATKWAIEGLTQSLARELPRGMAAVPLNPGVINTDMLQLAFGEAAGRYGNANAWSHAAAPYILQLGPAQNGKPVSVEAW